MLKNITKFSILGTIFFSMINITAVSEAHGRGHGNGHGWGHQKVIVQERVIRPAYRPVIVRRPVVYQRRYIAPIVYSYPITYYRPGHFYFYNRLHAYDVARKARLRGLRASVYLSGPNWAVSIF